jgi:hypothetical protein
MKATPRRAERELASIIKKVLEASGYDNEFERIPILGRTGPDHTFPNPLFLAIDVKSRKACPKGIFEAFNPKHPHIPVAFPLWNGVRLPYFLQLIGESYTPSTFHSISVERWMKHMTEWTDARKDDAIPALILRRPGMPYEQSVLLIPTDQTVEWIVLLRDSGALDAFRHAGFQTHIPSKEAP